MEAQFREEDLGDSGEKFFSGEGAMVSAEASDGVAPFVANYSGLWQVTVDLQSNSYFMIPVKRWGIIGSATADGWSSDQDIPQDLMGADGGSFEGTGITLRAGPYKLRFNDVWGVDRTDPFEPNGLNWFCNFGESAETPQMGGGDIAFPEGQDGVYAVTISYTPGQGYMNMAIGFNKTGDVEPLPEYPEAMYVTGAGTPHGWATPGDSANATMYGLAQGPEGVYWTITHLTADTGWKISASGWGDPNLGHANVDEFDAEGIAVTADTDGNMVVAEGGIVIVVLDLRDDMTKVSVRPAEVFGIGDAFGSWDAGVAENKFTNDNDAGTVTSPATSADGNLRMYASHPWIPDWWKAEFNVFDGKIVFRGTGGDQDAVASTTGAVVTLKFDFKTGSIN